MAIALRSADIERVSALILIKSVSEWELTIILGPLLVLLCAYRFNKLSPQLPRLGD